MWERLSYFITAVAAVLGWLITHYVDRVTQTPTVEYTISQGSSGAHSRATYRLTNVNRTQAFGPIEVRFIAAEGSPIRSKLVVRPTEPASEGRNPGKTSPGSAAFDLPMIYPGQTFTFELTHEGPARPHLYLSTAGDAQVVRFTGRSLDTWVATNETEIVLALIILWAAVLFGLVGFAIRAGSRETDAAAHSSGQDKGKEVGK
jgi:hypothetical protein